MNPDVPVPAAAGARAAAAAVHLFTASGAVWGLLAIRALGERRIESALAFMAAAVVVDAVDGALARRFRVKQVLPGIDGTLLDNLVDYLNSVIVPAYLLHQAALVPERLGPAAAAAICLASAFQFAQTDAKTPDHLFKGFPSYWNIVVFYLLLLRPDPGLALAIVLALCAMVFVPVYYVYPSRTPQHRRLTLALGGLWTAAVVWMLVEYPSRRPWLVYLSLLYLAYYGGVSLKLTLARRRRRRR